MPSAQINDNIQIYIYICCVSVMPKPGFYQFTKVASRRLLEFETEGVWATKPMKKGPPPLPFDSPWSALCPPHLPPCVPDWQLRSFYHSFCSLRFTLRSAFLRPVTVHLVPASLCQCPTLHGQQVLPFFAERTFPLNMLKLLSSTRTFLSFRGHIRGSHFPTHSGDHFAVSFLSCLPFSSASSGVV